MGDEDLKRRYAEAETVEDIIFYGYLYQEQKCFGLDYNDLIMLTLHLFEPCHPVRSGRGGSSTSWSTSSRTSTACSTSSWRRWPATTRTCSWWATPTRPSTPGAGADVRYLLDFDKRFPGTHTVMMLENYRSAPRVLSAANSLIEKNRERMPKRSRRRRTTHGPTVWHHAKSSADEAAWIAQGASRCTARAWRTATWRCSTAPTTPRGRWRRPVARRDPPRCAQRRAVLRPPRGQGRAVVPAARRRPGRPRFPRAWRTCPSATWGQRRMAFLRQQADERGCSLYEALARSVDDEPFKRTKARQLLDLIERFRASCEGRPVSEVLAAVPRKAATSACCAPREARSGSTTWPSSSNPSTSSKPRAGKR